MRLLLLLMVTVLAACGPSAEDLPTYGTVPPFTLTTQTGAALDSRNELAGRIWIADFFFTTCTGPCPRMSARMRRIQQDLSDLPDVRLVSFSVDPEHDTPAALAEYAQRFQADQNRWHLLTGDVATLGHLCKDVFMLGNVDGKNLDHSTRFVLVDRTGVVRGYYVSGDSASMEQLEKDVRLLASEKS